MAESFRQDAASPRRILKATDRCDWRGCGAAAYVRVFFESGSVDACGHHFAEAPASFLGSSMYHVDETWAI